MSDDKIVNLDDRRPGKEPFDLGAPGSLWRAYLDRDAEGGFSVYTVNPEPATMPVNREPDHACVSVFVAHGTRSKAALMAMAKLIEHMIALDVEDDHPGGGDAY